MPSWYVEDAFAEEAFATPIDISHFDRALRAVVEAKALRDTIAVSFETVKPIAFGDRVTEDSRFGDVAAQPL